MALAERCTEILEGLPRGWTAARLDLALEDEAQADRAALVLGPATPGRSGATFRLAVHAGAERLAPGPELVRRVLGRLDEEGIRARLTLRSHEGVAPAERPARPRRGLAETWDGLLTGLPPDWSDLYAEVELDSSDYVARGALLLAPTNPALLGGPTALRFRCARRFGYGVAPGMARRCLERLDAEGITGEVRILRFLSDTEPVATQGPVWRVGGRAV